MQHASRTIIVDPLSPEELSAMRRAHSERGFDAALRRAGRLGFLSADAWGVLGSEEAACLRRAETAAVLDLAGTPTRTDEQRVAKARLIRAWRDGGEAAPLVDAMLEAALEADRSAVTTHRAMTGRHARERS